MAIPTNPIPTPINAGVTSEEENLTYITHKFSVPESLMIQTTPMETMLTETLLKPGLQTTLKVHSWFDSLPIKNLDAYKGATVDINIERPINAVYDAGSKLKVSQTVYRLGCFNKADKPNTRKLINDTVEEYTLHACDPTLLNDAGTLVNKSWKCTPPSPIVAEMLACVRARATDVEPSCCPRDYTAENIHPFQVIDQQADAALIGGSPSFLHYMTYENLGTHKFRSLDTLVKQAPVANFFFDSTGLSAGGFSYVYGIMTYNFPCDFDLLSDILNGIGLGGSNLSSLSSFNPFNRFFDFIGSKPLMGCYPATLSMQAMTNLGSEGDQFSCPDYSQQIALKRQARMGLLEQDKLALNLVVPWNPDLNAGKVIRLTLKNKIEPSLLNYGSGTYLIHTVTHNIKYGGYATTTLDCVSTTVGGGVV